MRGQRHQAAGEPAAVKSRRRPHSIKLVARHFWPRGFDLTPPCSSLGNIETTTGDFRAAEDHYSDAISRYRAAGREYGTVNALRGLAEVARHSGLTQTAAVMLDEALRRSIAAGYRLGEANGRLVVGAVAVETRRLDETRAQLAEAIHIYTELGDGLGDALARMRLGDVAVALWDLDTAANSYSSARAVFHRETDPIGEASATFALATVTQQPAEASELFAESSMLFDHAGIEPWATEAHLRSHSGR